MQVLQLRLNREFMQFIGRSNEGIKRIPALIFGLKVEINAAPRRKSDRIYAVEGLVTEVQLARIGEGEKKR